MFQNYGYECNLILKEAENISRELKHPYVGTEHLMLSLLKKDNNIKEYLKQYELTYTKFKKVLSKTIKWEEESIETIIYTPMLKNILMSVSMTSEENNEIFVTPLHLLWGILENESCLATRLVKKMQLPLKKICQDLNKMLPKKYISSDLEILKIGTMWPKNNKCIVNREEEINRIIETLLKKEKPNPILVGKSGVGKTAIVEELARRIKNKEVPQELLDIKIINLEMSSLIAGTKYRGEFEERMQKIVKELKEEKNIIVFIDEIHSMVSAGGAEGAIRASDILKPSLARGEIRIIGATTLEEYNEYIVKDKALCRRFDVINIEEPSLKDMENILKSVIKEYEKHYNIIIPSNLIKPLITYSNKYIYNTNNPDKTINLLDTVCSSFIAKKSTNKENIIINNLEIKKQECIKKKRFKEAYKIARNLYYYKNKNSRISKKDIEESIERITKIKVKGLSRAEKENLYSLIEKNTSFKRKEIDNIFSNKIINIIKTTETVNDIQILSKLLGRHLITIDLEEYNNLDNIIGKWGINEEEYILKELMLYPSSILLFINYEESDESIKRFINKAINNKYFNNYKNDKIAIEHALIFIDNKTKNQYLGFKRKELALTLDKC